MATAEKSTTQCRDMCLVDFRRELEEFSGFNRKTHVMESSLDGDGAKVPVYVNEFWTKKQRDGHSLHEISYRACFKPQLPRFFIEYLSRPGDFVFDPFMGRGTTPLEAALLDRVPIGNDLNPLCIPFVQPRFFIPPQKEVAARLGKIDWEWNFDHHEDLLAFYHPKTLDKLHSLRAYFSDRIAKKTFDEVDGWIRMVAMNRLTGHSPGFFSVYTMPPNQAVSADSQRKINAKREQVPPERDVVGILLKKSKSLMRNLEEEENIRLRNRGGEGMFLSKSADDVGEIASDSIQLVVTSPPFLDTVDYKLDNWLRGWFCGYTTKQMDLAVMRKLSDWRAFMLNVFCELHRVLKPGGYIAFEVGEIRKGSINLEEVVLSVGIEAGLKAELIMINDQEFTKTSQCWGVDNLKKGTNTNRIVVFQKV